VVDERFDLVPAFDGFLFEERVARVSVAMRFSP
jgi:hypothetical protein